MKDTLVNEIIVVVVLLLIFGGGYLNFMAYQQRFPNASAWTWLFQ